MYIESWYSFLISSFAGVNNPVIPFFYHDAMLYQTKRARKNKNAM
jgi:hypothetical protein